MATPAPSRRSSLKKTPTAPTLGAATSQPKKKATLEKRLSLSDQINRIGTLGSDELFELMEEYEDLADESVRFRWQSLSTQERQNRHLAVYLQWSKVKNRLPEDATEEQVRDSAFPDDHKLFLVLLRIFLMIVFSYGKPRDITASHIDYATLCQYRDSMLFWTPRMYEEKDIAGPTKSLIWNAATQGMRTIWKKRGAKQKPKGMKVSLGIEEIRQLFDHEMSNSPTIAVSEQHQAIWCILRQTAVRPGAIGPSKRSKGFLTWRDITFRAGSHLGRFVAHIRFVNLKTNLDDPETSTRQGGQRVLDCYLNSPNEENITFSVPHRLLLIAIRRGLLVNVKTIDDLFSSKLANFKILESALDEPVFYAAGPRGLSIDNSKPLSTYGIGGFMAHRGWQLGYSVRIHPYAFRRKAATDLVGRIGIALTKHIMGHALEQSTLERYYLHIAPSLQLTELALGEGIEKGARTTAVNQDTAPLAIGKLEEAQLNKIRGAALNALVLKRMEEDPDRPGVEASHAELKAYKKFVRKRCYQELSKEEHETLQSTLTVEQVNERILLSRVSTFAERVSARAAVALRDKDRVDENEAGFEDMDFDEDFEEPGDEEEVEEDAEHGHNASDQIELHVNTGEFADPKDGSSVASYVESAKAFMEIILEHSLTNHEIPFHARTEQERRCPLCMDDETISDKDREKIYANESYLNSHMEGKKHFPYMQWWRRQESTFLEKKLANKDKIGALNRTMEELADEMDDEEVEVTAAEVKRLEDSLMVYDCPYCPADDMHSYSKVGNVVKHVEGSSVKHGGLAHDDLKREDGWYDGQDFYGKLSTKARKHRLSQNRNILADAGVSFEPELLRSEPVPGRPGVFYGDFSDNMGKTDARHGDKIRLGSDQRGPYKTFPFSIEANHAADGVTTGDKAEPMVLGHIDKRFRGIVGRGDGSGFSDDDE